MGVRAKQMIDDGTAGVQQKLNTLAHVTEERWGIRLEDTLGDTISQQDQMMVPHLQRLFNTLPKPVRTRPLTTRMANVRSVLGLPPLEEQNERVV